MLKCFDMSSKGILVSLSLMKYAICSLIFCNISTRFLLLWIPLKGSVRVCNVFMLSYLQTANSNASATFWKGEIWNFFTREQPWGFILLLLLRFFASSIGNKKVQQGRTDIGSEKMLTVKPSWIIFEKCRNGMKKIKNFSGYIWEFL